MPEHEVNTELPTSEVPVTEAPAEVTTETVVEEQPRDLDQTLEAVWAEKNGETVTDPAQEATAEATVETPDQSQQEGTEPSTAAIGVPNAWSAEMQGRWADVPPEVQQYVAEREAQAHDQISRMGQEIAQVRPVRELLDTNSDLFDSAGVTMEDGLPMLFQAQRMLNENPIQGLAAIAQSFGIDLAQTFGPQGQQADPQIGALQHQVTQLQNQLSQQNNRNRMSEERESQARTAEAKTEIDNWGQDKPHFANENVRNMMGSLLSNGQAEGLDDAYDAACHAIPEIRNAIAEEAKAKAATEAAKNQEKVVKDAKRAAKTNLGKGKKGVPATGKGPNDDDYLGNVYDRAVGG